MSKAEVSGRTSSIELSFSETYDDARPPIAGSASLPKVAGLVVLSQLATVGAAVAAVSMIGSSFSDKSGMSLHNDDTDDDYTGALAPHNMLGVSLLLYVVPAGISLTWWAVEMAHRLPSRTPALALLGVLGLELISLSALALDKCGQPQNSFAKDRDPLQQFVGGWLFAAGLPLGLACLVILAWHLTGSHGAGALPGMGRTPPTPLPAFPSTCRSNACGIASALVALAAAFTATTMFSSVWNFSAGSYWPGTSPYALNPESWTIGTGPRNLLVKVYPDPIIFYSILAALTLGGAATYAVPAWRKLMHTRVGGSTPPPVGTWARWAHPAAWGSTVGEVLVVTAGAGLYIVWFVYWGVLFTHIQKEAEGMHSPALQRWARVFGHMATLSFALLMLPVARDSVWTAVFGVPFERAVKLHRWLGAAAYAWLTLHMLTWWLLWAEVGVLWNNITTTHNLVIDKRDNGHLWRHFDNFTMPFTHAGWLLLTLSIAVTLFARRRLFHMFYALHAYVGVVVLVTGVMHAWSNWYYTALGLTLYYLDRTWRFMRRTNSVVATADLLQGGAVTRLTLPAAALRTSLTASGGYTAGQYAWLLIPGVDEAEWHPFTISSAPSASPSTVTFHIKSMGRETWTGGLLALAGGTGDAKGPGTSLNDPSASAGLLGGGRQVLVAVDGPYGRPADFTSYPVLAFVAGGIGITPMISILSEVVHRRVLAREGGGAVGPLAASFTWCVREPEVVAEFGLALFDLLEGRGPIGSEVSVTIYCKALGGGAAAVHPALASLPSGAGAWIAARTTPTRPSIAQALADQRATVPVGEGLVLACGPAGLVDDASAGASAGGWALHHEEFSW